jgi:DNA-binding NarL/FixJ family response regulator
LAENLRIVSIGSGEGTLDELLSPHEFTITRLVARGVADRTIAAHVGLTEAEVGDALIMIFKKLALAGLLDRLLYIGEERRAG